MKCILYVGLAITCALVEPRRVAFIVREQRLPARGCIEVAAAQRIWKLQIVQRGCLEIIRDQCDVVVGSAFKTDQRLAARWIGPSPGIAEPEVRQQMQVGRFRARLKASMRIRMSSGPDFAYSTTTSK